MAKGLSYDLTKQMLLDWGIEVGEPIENGYEIYRTYVVNGVTRKALLKIQKVIHKHKYTPAIPYQQIQFRANGKKHNIYLHRVIYAWFNGIAHSSMDIDHIDNNAQNNRIENLQALTREENIAKKFATNNEYKKRLIYNIKKMRRNSKHPWSEFKESCYNISNKSVIDKYKGE